jgi:hypothetical protein
VAFATALRDSVLSYDLARLSRREKLAFGTLALLLIVARVVALFRYRFETDESQHLHVAWGWTAGLVQYRDLFDNHPPLFHLLSSFFLRGASERADILLFARAPMLVLWGIVLWGTWVVARRLYDAHVAAWSVLLLAVFPTFFLRTVEYRADHLWNVCWILAVVVVFARPLTPARSFIAGLLLGCALATSLRTSLLVITLLLAGAIVYGVRHAWRLLPGALGFAIVPAALALYFMRLDAWDELVYYVFTFNAELSQSRVTIWIGRILWPFAIAALFVIARKKKLGLLPASVALFVVTLFCLWPLISPRDFLAIMPFLAILIVAHLPRRVVIAVTALWLLSLAYYTDGFTNRTDEHITMMNQALRLTRPGEPVMDLKGETIYRPRPFFHALETITRARLDAGLLRDTIPEDVVRAKCHVAQADGPLFPPRGREFLRAHFLDVGRLRVSGQPLQPDGTFTIAVPGEYVLLNEGGEARGTLDGTPYGGARQLETGTHRFVSVNPGEALAVLWAPAFRRGHTPFHLRDREF